MKPGFRQAVPWLEPLSRYRQSASEGICPTSCRSGATLVPRKITKPWAETPETFPERVTVLCDIPHRVVMAAWERSLLGVVPSIWDAHWMAASNNANPSSVRSGPKL